MIPTDTSVKAGGDTAGRSGPPTLSVLLPTYNQPAGVERILRGLAAVRGRPELEILVSDDSSDDVAADRIRVVCEAFGGVRYTRNRPSLGAVPNWNALLRSASGEYAWLLHHDEEPAPDLDLPALLHALAQRGAADLFVLECRVAHQAGARPMLHFPARWAVAIVRRWPGYLLRRNLFGSPSTLIVRRRSYVRYDERLQWFVDVEAYLRILTSNGTIVAWPGAGVISHRDRTHSITASLASNLGAIESRERDLLRDVHGDCPSAVPWLGARARSRVARVFEAAGWAAFRSAYRGGQRLRGLRA